MAGHWKPLNTQPSFNAETMLLLTDGSVMVHEDGSNGWHRWTPSVSSPLTDYANGNWSNLNPMPDLPAGTPGGPTNAPQYFASAVLRDGRVFVAGGENNGNAATRAPGGAGNNAQLLAAQIYDPVTDAWTAITTFPAAWTQIGDASCCVLEDGRILVGNSNTALQPGSNLTAAPSTPAVFDPATGTWTPTGAKNSLSNEETWTLLPDGSVFTVQCKAPLGTERFAGNAWTLDANTPVTLTVPFGFGNEIGPAILLAGGRVLAIGGNANTALYTPPPAPTLTTPSPQGTWTTGPTFQDSQGHPLFVFAANTPACLLPNGRVLCCATPTILGKPTSFFEFDPTPPSKLQPTEEPSNDKGYGFNGRMLLVPSGQVLFSNGTQDIQVYTPDPGFKPEWQPNVTTVPERVLPGFTYRLAGIGFNGLSQAVSYGDDASMATNYPIVRLVNVESAHVHYGRTFDHSTMGVATGEREVETSVTIPWDMEAGAAQLLVIANGIPSNPATVTVAHVRSLRRWMVANGKNLGAPLLLQIPASHVSLAALLPA